MNGMHAAYPVLLVAILAAFVIVFVGAAIFLRPRSRKRPDRDDG